MLTIGLYGAVDPLGLQRSHDHSVAVMRDGKVLFCCELERVTGIKHDGRLDQYVESILQPWLNSEEDIQWVLVNNFMSDQFSSAGGNVIFENNGNLPVEHIFRKLTDKQYVLTHEMGHIAACLPFYGNFKANSLLIHIDGGASNSCASAWYFDGQKIQHLDHAWHPELKVAVNNFNANPLSAKILNIELKDHLSMPGKLMGYASFGKYSKILHQSLIDNHWYVEEAESVDICGSRGPDIACCMQRELEEQVLSYINKFKIQTGATSLYYAGGAALNIHANVRVERELEFESVFIPPAPSDCGLALGAAAFFDWKNGKEIKIHSAYLNSSIPESKTMATLSNSSGGICVVTDIDQVVTLIAEGEVVAVFAENGELGPRALGHRSLLIRPDSILLRKQLSEVMKQREWYRPVAPIMLTSTAELALMEYSKKSHLSRFMLGAWKVKKDWQQHFVGCIHADDTVRAQVVADTELETAHIHQLLIQLRDQHEIQGVINTSFNSRGVPIVGTFEQAITQSKKLGVKFLWRPPLTE
ncbi:hypothetical protein MT390_17280 [Vibrio sp. 2-Bac 85]